MAYYLIFWIFMSWAQAQDMVVDHGVCGALFEIVEEDMITVLKGKLQALKESGRLEEVQQAFQEKAKNQLTHPPVVSGLKETDLERQWTHDPTLLITSDIKNHQGNILAKKGERINPLHTLKPSQGLLFIDGDDPSHRDWAKNHYAQYIIVLVRGSPVELEKEVGVPIYFDQGGYLCATYHIQHIPARIEVTGDVLTITEFKVPSL
jgi:conjugal transfer pilus assembly protein TraW